MKTEMRGVPLGDLEATVRAAAFRLLFRSAEAITPESLAQATGIPGDRLAALLDDLDGAGRIRRDEAGRVVGSAGLSVVPDRHQIEIEGRRFWTWCAYDFLGIFGALQASGRAWSRIPSTGEMIHLDFIAGRPQKSSAVLFQPDTELFSRSDNVYEEWCSNSNLFADHDAARKWAREHGLQGRVLTLTEAADLAPEAWKTLTNGGEVDLDSKP